MNIIPNSKWLVKDDNKNIRIKSKDIILPLSKENDELMKKMISFVKFSQDPKKNKDEILRPAVGIAAPQLGSNVNMYYIKLTKKIDNDKDVEYALINPKIIGTTNKKIALKYGEGCLSVDEHHEGYVERCYKVIIEAYDYFTKKNVKLTLKQYEAIVAQHEQDHLEGKLYYDHINKENPWEENAETIYI